MAADQLDPTAAVSARNSLPHGVHSDERRARTRRRAQPRTRLHALQRVADQPQAIRGAATLHPSAALAKYGDVARQPHPAPVSTRARAPDCAATRAAPAACLASAGSCLTALAAAAAAKPATKLAAIAKDGYV